MIQKTKILLLLLLILLTVLSANDIKEKTETTIKNMFGKDIKYEMITFHIPNGIKNKIEKEVKQKFFEDKIYIWKVTKNGKAIGFAVLDNVYGKSLPITFLVIFDEQNTIINSSIIKYREPYGGAVRNDKWNQQFANKDSSSGFEVGEDIDGISGATISVRSVSKGIRKLVLLMPKIKDQI